MPCRSDLSCHKAFASARLAEDFATDSSPVARLVRGIGSPDGPTDAGELVGQRDGRLVVPDAPLQLQSPLLQTTEARGIDPVQLRRSRQYRARTRRSPVGNADVAAQTENPIPAETLVVEGPQREALEIAIRPQSIAGHSHLPLDKGPAVRRECIFATVEIDQNAQSPDIEIQFTPTLTGIPAHPIRKNFQLKTGLCVRS